MPEAPTLEPPQVQAPASSPTMDAFDSTFADLDDHPHDVAPEPPPSTTPTPAPTTATERPKDPATGKFVAKTEKVEELPKPATPEVSKAPDKPAEGTTEYHPPMVAKPSELKRWAQKMGDRAQTAEQQLSKLNSRLRELESKPSESVDVKALTDELANTKKRLEEYEGELKVTRYERSGEYKEKYEKPYQKAWQDAYNDVGELLVIVPDPNDPDNPKERQATASDFDEVYNLPLGPATKLAKQKFGDAYTEVLKHRSAIKGAAKAALEAVSQHKGKAAEFDQQQTVQKQMEEQGRNMMVGEAIKAINQKYPDLFNEREGDSEWNEGLKKGKHMADMAYGDRKGMTPQQSAVLDAQVYLRIAGYPSLKSERDSLKSQLAAKDKEISELRGSAPGKGTPAAPKTEEPGNLTMDQAFDKFVP